MKFLNRLFIALSYSAEIEEEYSNDNELSHAFLCA